MLVLHAAETVKGGVSTILNQHLELCRSDCRISKLILVVPEAQRGVLMFGGHAGDKVELKGFRGSTRLQRCFFLALTLIFIRLTVRIEVLHLHSTFAGAIGRLIFFFWNGTTLYQPHGVAFDPDRVARGVRFRCYRLFEYLLSWLTDAVIAISHYEKKLLDDVHLRCPVVLVTNGVLRNAAVEAKSVRSEDLLFVGRLDKQKGLDILISNWNVVCPHRRLLVAGDSVLKSQGSGAELSTSTQIVYLGWVDAEKLPSLMRNCFAVVVPSRWEGFGLVAAEALASGTPVIASNRGALPEIVSSDIGAIFELENLLVEFPRAIDEVRLLYRNTHLEERCIRRWQDFFNAEISIKSTVDCYELFYKKG